MTSQIEIARQHLFDILSADSILSTASIFIDNGQDVMTGVQDALTTNGIAIVLHRPEIQGYPDNKAGGTALEVNFPVECIDLINKTPKVPVDSSSYSIIEQIITLIHFRQKGGHPNVRTNFLYVGSIQNDASSEEGLRKIGCANTTATFQKTINLKKQ